MLSEVLGPSWSGWNTKLEKVSDNVIYIRFQENFEKWQEDVKIVLD